MLFSSCSSFDRQKESRMHFGKYTDKLEILTYRVDEVAQTLKYEYRSTEVVQSISVTIKNGKRDFLTALRMVKGLLTSK